MTADEFRTLRRAKGWTRAELATMMEISPQAIYQWETGTRNISPAVAFHVRALAGQTPKRTGKKTAHTQEPRP